MTVTPRQSAQSTIIQTACEFIGTLYELGGESHAGIDCSGLVRLAWTDAGVWPFEGDAGAASIWANCPKVAFEDRQAGDVIAFWTNPIHNHDCHHVVLVLDRDHIIGANSGGPPWPVESHEEYAARMAKVNARVKIAPAEYWASHRLGVVRAPKLHLAGGV